MPEKAQYSARAKARKIGLIESLRKSASFRSVQIYKTCTNSTNYAAYLGIQKGLNPFFA